jgi:hypothetical protein
MAVQSTRTVNVVFSGDAEFNTDYDAAVNPNSPGGVDVVNLTTGANTITVPTGGTTVTACTIIPPSANTIQMTLKGVTGDTGINLHLTDPTSLALAAGVVSFCLTAASGITGVRIVWS